MYTYTVYIYIWYTALDDSSITFKLPCQTYPRVIEFSPLGSPSSHGPPLQAPPVRPVPPVSRDPSDPSKKTAPGRCLEKMGIDGPMQYGMWMDMTYIYIYIYTYAVYVYVYDIYIYRYYISIYGMWSYFIYHHHHAAISYCFIYFLVFSLSLGYPKAVVSIFLGFCHVKKSPFGFVWTWGSHPKHREKIPTNMEIVFSNYLFLPKSSFRKPDK